MFSKCNTVFSFHPNLSKAKKNFEEGNCEKSARYILGKFTTNKKEDKIINNIKSTNEKVKQIFEEENFNGHNCAWAIKQILAEESCSKSNIDDIMLKVAPGIEVAGHSNDTPDL